MSLNMYGHIDSVFKSTDVVVTYRDQGEYGPDGIWIPGPAQTESYVANIQPLSDRKLDNLLRAGQRIVDGRHVYINTGDFEKLALAQEMSFLGQRWKIVESDVRPWHKYARIVASRFDDQ